MNKSHKTAHALVAACVGAAAFLAIYGTTPLHVSRDDWMLFGNGNSDTVQHYAGWLAFRASEWQFPLGMAGKMACGDGTIISYTDSIPIMALFFKLIRGILPETFQYFGVYALLCHMLQGAAGFLALERKTKSAAYSHMGSLFFCFATTPMFRLWGHTALCSHWLILFAICVYFTHKEKARRASYIRMALLEILSVGIHPYFLPMVAVFALLCLAEDVRRKDRRAIVFFFAGLAATCLFGWCIGVLGHGVSISRTGYGYYSMNLNAIVNPMDGSWSRFLKPLPMILGNYEGFNYLGAGVLLGIAALAAFALLSGNAACAAARAKANLPLVAACAFLSLFAVSNVVTLNDMILFEIPIRGTYRIGGIFRSSGRLFWPVQYLIIIYTLHGLWLAGRSAAPRRVFALLAVLLCVQLCDLSLAIKNKRAEMAARGRYRSELLEDKALGMIGSGSRALILDNFSDERAGGGMTRRTLSVWAFKHNMDVYFSVANSGNYSKSEEESARIAEGIRSGRADIGSAVIVTTDESTAASYSSPNIRTHKAQNCYFLYNSMIGAEEAP